MKTLVTGGAGFIGSNLVKLLLNEGHSVKIIDNFSTGYAKNLEFFKNDIEIFEGDIRDRDFCMKKTKNIDIVFHMAANIGNVKSLKNPQEDSEINVIGTLNMLEAAKENKIMKFVYSSSAAIFGELKSDTIIEEHPLHPDSPYGVSKLSGEKHVECYSKLFDFKSICLRYFNVYGINQRYDEYGNVIPIFMHRIQNGKKLIIFGDGTQTRDFVNVFDVARANLYVAEKVETNEVFNLGTGTSMSINNLAKFMSDICSVDNIIEYQKPRKGEVKHCRANISKLKSIGYYPSVPLQEGLKEYIEWYKREVKVDLG